MNSLISFLTSISVLSAQNIESITSLFVAATLKKGDYFIREGAYANEIAFLQRGAVRAFYTNSNGKEYNKTFFVAPAIIGSYVSLINKEKNTLPQQALSECVIWRMKYHELKRLSDNNYELERLRRCIAERFFVGNEKKQLEMALMDATERYFIFKEEYPGVEDIIPQYHIASYLGISPTQLSRLRKKIS